MEFLSTNNYNLTKKWEKMALKVTVCNFCTFDKITREKIVDCSKFATKYGGGAL